MRLLLLILFLFLLSPKLKSQDVQVINYPIEFLFKGNVLKDLEQYGMYIKELKKFQNTFISTPEFIKRFEESYYNPLIFEYYATDSIRLSQVDSLVVKYYELKCSEPALIEEDETGKIISNSRDLYLGLKQKFEVYANEGKGFLKFIDYSKINFKAKDARKKLKEQGLEESQIIQIFRLIRS